MADPIYRVVVGVIEQSYVCLLRLIILANPVYDTVDKNVTAVHFLAQGVLTIQMLIN